MTLGEKISLLRKERSLTQAELGNKLGVTYQAVSKWERDESMPDFEMISKLARLFGVPITYFENNGSLEENKEAAETQSVETIAETADTETNVLGVCTVCGKYVDKDNVGAETPKLICKPCYEQQQEAIKNERQKVKQQAEAQKYAVSYSIKKRVIIASVVAGIIALTLLILSFVNISYTKELLGLNTAAYVVSTLLGFVVVFVWIFQLFFDGAVRSVTLAGMFFIRLPGIIFSADLDGLIFLIVMKILFFIISAVVFVGAMVVTSIAGIFVSLVTFIPLVIKLKRGDDSLL